VAINYLIGKPGNGKTYGVLKRVILPALREGRTVLTNIEGLYHDKIAEYLGLELDDVKARLVIIDKKVPYDSKFWYDEDEPEGCIVQPGNIIVLDEANRYLGTLAQPFNPRKPPSDKYQAVIWPVFEVFCREHRHYVDASGQSTDVWFLSQGFKDIKHSYHGVIDMTVLTTKLDFMDRPNEFKMFYFNGAVNPHGRRGEVMKSWFRCEPGGGAGEKFDPEIGKLYHSHRGGKGQEKNTDSNKSLWGQKVFFNLLTLKQAKYVSFAVAIVGLILAGLFMAHVFSKAKVQSDTKALIPPSVSNAGATKGNPFVAAQAAVPASGPEVPAYAKDEDQTLTLVGFEDYGDKVKIAVLLDKSARYRYITDFKFVDNGPASYIVYQGKKVSRWTGPGLITTKKVETK
jgi:zona occludens toxin